MSERHFVKYTFLKLDPAWRRLDAEQREQDKREFIAACEETGTVMRTTCAPLEDRTASDARSRKAYHLWNARRPTCVQRPATCWFSVSERAR